MKTNMTKQYIFRLTEQDYARFAQMSEIENKYYSEGYRIIAGIDEAGRGPLAGPVFCAACILDPNKPIYGLNDSKKLTEKRRNYLYKVIKEQALAYKIVSVSMEEIEDNNILGATKRGMTDAALGLDLHPDLLLIDAERLQDERLPAQRSIKHGDAVSNSIAAASVLAKVSRDNFMIAMDEIYPEYQFAKHKGYATAAHYAAIKKHGICELHRLSFLHKLRLGSTKNQKHRTYPERENDHNSDTMKMSATSTNKGVSAENQVAKNLTDVGYKVLEQNFWLRPYGEIDLILQKNKRLCFVEVKSRQSSNYKEQAIGALDDNKKWRIKKLAEYYAISRKIDFEEMIFLLAACKLNSNNQIEKIKYYNF
ncbi:MAG TPA: ribonuclease HII [Clostridiaceae bacterium]|nr:ribonuclease HII [Clostridiaceae bacterium]